MPRESSEWTPWHARITSALLALGAMVVFAIAAYRPWSKASVAIQPVAKLDTVDYHALAFDPRDPNIVYFGHHYGVMKSVDGGVTWSPVLRYGDAMSLATHPAFGSTVFLAGHYVFMRSDDNGLMWKAIQTNLPDLDIHGFAILPSKPQTFFAYIVNYGLWRSDDAGATWKLITDQLPQTVMALTASENVLLAGTMDRGLLKSADGGVTWKSAEGLNAKIVMTLANDPRDARIVFAGSDQGLFRSDADQKGWTRVGLAGKNLMAIAISRANPSRILAVDATGRVYRSDDGGVTW